MSDQRWGAQPGHAPILGPDARVWHNGALVRNQDLRLGVMTHSLHYGYGLFEGIRAYQQAGGGSAVFRLREHIARLFDGAKILRLVLPVDAATVMQACVDTLVANRLAEGYVRPLAYVAEGRMGIYSPQNRVDLAIAAWPWGVYLGPDALQKGIRARVSSFTRTAVNTNMVRAKVTGQYITSILARDEAALAGCDEAILLDKDGYCAEGSGENLFSVRAGVLRTPPLSSPILAGVTRDAVLQIAGDLGVPVNEEQLTRDDLYIGDEAFFTGTAAEITPIREVDGRPIGSGQPGPITRRLQDEFFRVVRGQEARRSAWRTTYTVAAS